MRSGQRNKRKARKADLWSTALDGAKRSGKDRT